MQTFGSFDARKPGDPAPGMYVPVLFPSLIVLNERTRDGRLIQEAGFGTLDLPRSIKLMTVTAGGHDGSEVCGRLDEIVVDGVNVSASGWLNDDYLGRRAAYLLRTMSLRGNSVDLSVKQEDVKISVEETPDGTLVMQMDFTNAMVKATTLCTEPAFENAGAIVPDGWHVDGFDENEEGIYYAGGPTDVDLAAVTAAATPATPEHAFAFSVISERPKIDADKFAQPKLSDPTPVFVDEDEHVFGHIAAWNSRHLNLGIYPPKSKTGYAYFATGCVMTTDGPVSTGRLLIGGDHAPGDLGWREALDVYANTTAAWADVAVGEDDHGIWVSGIVRPGTTNEVLHAARASAESGHWCRIGANLELIASLAVNAPGFPIPKARTFGHEEGFPLSLIGAGALAPAAPALMHTSIDPRFSSSLEFVATKFATEEARGLDLDSIEF